MGDIMKQFISIIAVIATIIQSQPIIANAKNHYTNTDKKFTYNELLNMSNEKFNELFDYSDYYFGDDSVPDEVKFSELLNEVPKYYIGDNWNSLEYSAYKKFINEECTAYIPFYVKDEVQLSDELTPSDLGYPDDWNLTICDKLGYRETEVTYVIHEYRLEIPLNVIADFEKFVRLNESYHLPDQRDLTEKFGIKYVGSIYNQFNSLGDIAPLTLLGDSNCDNVINMADAVLIMQSISAPDKYKLTVQGTINADVDGKNGITNKDALRIQQYMLRLIDNF